MKILFLLPVAALLLNGCDFDDREAFYECSLIVQREYTADISQADKVCSELGETPLTSITWFRYFGSPQLRFTPVPREQCIRMVALDYPQLSSESLTVLCSPRP